MSHPKPIDLHQAISANRRRRGPGWLWLLLLLAVGAGGAWWWKARSQPATTAPTYVTEPLARGDLRLTITATGNLEPTNQVTVGSEVSGTSQEVYVETNHQVKKDQPLARLDTSRITRQIEGSRAGLVSAKARVAQSEATLREAKAALARQKELHRLSGGKLPSKAEMESAVAVAERAEADLGIAQASVGEAEAQISMLENDLQKAIIKSPIDGIVLVRSLEPGQTVAASFTAPELFVIAEKLEQMKLKVAIAEADIARVSAGQKATFTVDAWPGRTYTATVLKVAFGSAVVDNVVTYETELEVANDDLSLRPGMTATADIAVAESKATFRVPNAALRFDPQEGQSGGAPGSGGPAAAGGGEQRSFVQNLVPRPPRRSRGGRGGGSGAGGRAPRQQAQVWVLEKGEPVALPVTLGMSDGRHTAISGEGLKEGLPIILRRAPATP